MNTFNAPIWQRLLKRLAWWLFALGLLVLLMIGTIGWLGIQTQPLLADSPAVDKAQLVRQVLQARLLSRTFHGEDMALTLPLPQFNALLGDLAQRTLGARAELSALSVTQQTAHGAVFTILASVPTAQTPLKQFMPYAWINLQSRWRIGSDGQLQLLHAQCGHLPLPVGWVRGIFDAVLQHYEVQTLVDIGWQSVNHLNIDKHQLTVRWKWGADLRARSLIALIPGREFSRVHIYQQALAKQIQAAQAVAVAHNGVLPLIAIMKPMFQLAQQRTLAKQLIANNELSKEQIPIHENRAVLLVLVAHAFGIDWAQFLPQAKAWTQTLPYPFTLKDRVDFSQHYLLSALIASGMGGRVADLIGLYKEQSDKVAGSGFSFNDIAADRAGVRFGQQARYAAQQLQSRVQEGESEDFFMPDVTDMPQYLTAHQFEQQFKGKNHADYNTLLNLIDARVNQLGVLR